MARPAPSVDRIVSVLTYMARRPRERFTLTQLTRALDLNPATAHALLTTLVERGFLVRRPETKEYGLGPALVEIGASAAAQVGDVADFAQDELRRLSSAIGQQCIATSVIGNEIVTLARVGEIGPSGLTVQVGQRFPLLPPFGTVFLAWSDRAVVERWLLDLDPVGRPEALERCAAALDATRERGYAVGLDGGLPPDEISQRWAQRVDDARPRNDERAAAALNDLLESGFFLLDLDSAAVYSVRHVSVPVFDAEGSVVLALTALFLGEKRSGAEVTQVGQTLSAGAARVTAAIHGTAPGGSVLG